MPDEKARVGFSLDFKDSKQQIDGLVKSLEKVKTGFKDTGKQAETSLDRVSLGMKSVFKNITTLSTNLRKGISDGQKISQKQLKTTLDQAKTLEGRLAQIHSKTSQKFEQAEGKKRSALKATMKEQQKAVKAVQRVGEATAKSIKDQQLGYAALASFLTVKMSSVLRELVKESALLAARNEVLGTAMRTVGNNAGISNAELERTEIIVRKLGISINDTRELISRFAQANLGMANATKLARAAQDLAAGSTLGSSEALRIMTQSILSLLPRQLRQFGVVVNLNQVYQEQSRILGKSVNDLTSLEKRQGLLNKIFEEAAKRAGAYERSMEDTGKVLTTLTSRIIPDTLSMIGDQFLPVLEALVFGFKDILQWIQRQEGAFRTFIATVLAVAAAVTTLVTALVTLKGIMGLSTGGFIGATTAMKTTLATIGPLAIGVAALAAALVVLPKLFEETATAQERSLESAKGLLNLEIERLSGLEDLRKVLENQALTEDDLRKIIESNAKAHKELIPLIGKEKITREELLKVIDQEIFKNKEVLKIAKERAELAGKEQIKVLEEQQRQTNKLVTALDFLQKKYGEGKVPVLVLAGALRVFQNKIEDAGGSIENVADAMRDFADENDGGMQNLLRASQKLGERISGLKQDVDTGFGTAATEMTQSASDMQQALKGIEADYDKMVKKLAKKFPFEALAKEEVERLETISSALENNLITEEKAAEKRLQVQALFNERRRVMELKYQQQLESLGKTQLEKIEANRKKAVDLARGSEKAIAAIELESTVARNAVYEKMWTDRLQVIQESVNGIVATIKTERDLAIGALNQESAVILAQERMTADSRIRVRIDFYDKAMSALRSSQEEESAARQQHYDAVANSIQELFNKGIINEEQFNARSKALATDLNNFRQQQISERVEFLKSALSEMYNEEASISERLKQLDKDRAKAERATQDTIRQIQQQGLNDEQLFFDERKRAQELLNEGQTALMNDNFERVKEINNEIKSIALNTSKEVREGGKKDADVLISADKARIGSIKLVEQAGQLLQQSFEAQRAAEESALGKVKDKIDAIKSAIDDLVKEKKQINIEVAGNAEKQIDTIQSKLDALQDKTVTVTVITRQVTVGGGTAGTTAGGGEAAAGGPVPAAPPAGGTPGLAEGAVDIQGPGTSFSDSIIAFLSRGESVINAAATKMFAPILELMNSDPGQVRKLIRAPAAAGGALGVRGGGATNIGDVNININGIESKDVQNINWRKVVREQISPELKKLTNRTTKI